MNQAGKDRKAKRKGVSKISRRRRGMHLALLKFYNLETPQSNWQLATEYERIAIARRMVKASRPQPRRRHTGATGPAI